MSYSARSSDTFFSPSTSRALYQLRPPSANVLSYSSLPSCVLAKHCTLQGLPSLSSTGSSLAQRQHTLVPSLKKLRTITPSYGPKPKSSRTSSTSSSVCTSRHQARSLAMGPRSIHSSYFVSKSWTSSYSSSAHSLMVSLPSSSFC